MIDQPLAKRLFPGKSAIGRIIGPRNPGLRVVGVVAPIRQSDLTKGIDVAGTVYIPNIALQNQVTIVMRTRLPFAQSAALLRSAVNHFDPRLAPVDVAPLTAVIDRSVEARSLASQVLAIFGALALILAALGVYGVLSYAMAERVPEIGIRIAIGATPANILAMVFRDGLVLVVGGIGMGLVGFVAIGRLLASLVFGVSTFSVPVLAVGVVVLFAIAMMATAVPAVRASRVDPVKALNAG
jgi:ABC-type antimicrobial peptide transport system permease subunit